MCIQVIERYGVCRCLYYKRAVDRCGDYHKSPHEVQTREVLVGYRCPQHTSSRDHGLYRTSSSYHSPSSTLSSYYGISGTSASDYHLSGTSSSDHRPSGTSSSVHRPSGATARRQALKKHQSDTPLEVNRSESLVSAQTKGLHQRVTDRSDNRPAVGSEESIGQSLCFASDLEDADIDAPKRELLLRLLRKDYEDRGQQVVATPDLGGSHIGQSELQTPLTSTASPGQFDTRHAPSPGENICPHHLLHSAGACPRECCWVVEQSIERGNTTTEISRRQLYHLLRDSLISAFANLLQRIGPTTITQSSVPCMGTNSHTITDMIELDTLQIDRSREGSTSRAPQPPIANLQETESPFPATSHTKETKKWPFIPPCYLLIFLGVLTVIGSLVPGLWRAISRNDLSGGFSLAQYILGVGIFVVGSMVAIHSKNCECWKTHNQVDQVVDASH